jgi:uncharacterized protein YpbB
MNRKQSLSHGYKVRASTLYHLLKGKRTSSVLIYGFLYDCLRFIPLKIVALLLLVEFHLSLCDTEFVSPSKVFQEIEKQGTCINFVSSFKRQTD